MAADALPTVPRLDPEHFAAAQQRLFTGRNLRIGRSTTVHALAWRDWINGLSLPFPACHQGWSGVGAAGELHPTELTPSCLKCRRIRCLPVDGDAEQPALFVLPAQPPPQQGSAGPRAT